MRACPNCHSLALLQAPTVDAWSCLVCGFLICGELISERAALGGLGSESEAGSSSMLAADPLTENHHA